MKIMFHAIWTQLFEPGKKQLEKTLFLYVIVFVGLRNADIQIEVSPFVLCLTVGVFTFHMMWQALSSGSNAANFQNLFMMPFQEWPFIFSYVSALGLHTILTKTAGLFAVVFALSPQKVTVILCCILCAGTAVLMSAYFHAQKPHGKKGLSTGIDAYSFYPCIDKGRQIRKPCQRHSIWRYLFRYLTAHKNYLVNTAVLWGAACVLPAFLGQIEGLFVMPIGFAILSLNTPLGILLSCDPNLEQALRFLPRQKQNFLLAYGLFLFAFNLAADMIFLCSWLVRFGKVSAAMLLAAVLFALLSAAGSVLLEWFFPLRNWSVESDLWHHPRKYVVAVVMLLVACVCSVFISVSFSFWGMIFYF